MSEAEQALAALNVVEILTPVMVGSFLVGLTAGSLFFGGLTKFIFQMIQRHDRKQQRKIKTFSA